MFRQLILFLSVIVAVNALTLMTGASYGFRVAGDSQLQSASSIATSPDIPSEVTSFMIYRGDGNVTFVQYQMIQV